MFIDMALSLRRDASSTPERDRIHSVLCTMWYGGCASREKFPDKIWASNLANAGRK